MPVARSLSFDKAQSLDTLFRRVGDSGEYVGLMYWPADASSATLQLADGNNRWAPIDGRLDAGRPRLRELTKGMVTHLEAIEKEYKNALARSNGRDEIRTMRLP